MRTPFKKPLEPGDRVRLLKASRRELGCARVGSLASVSAFYGDVVRVILDCGHAHDVRREHVAVDINRICTWCGLGFPASQTQVVPFWRSGGELCMGCWAQLEITRHLKTEAVKQMMMKGKRRKRE